MFFFKIKTKKQMKNIKNISIIIFLAGIFSVSSCTKDLDRQPFVDVTTASVYADASNYRGILAKVYASLALTGQTGPAGQGDIGGIDEGFSNYMRMLWYAQELTTEEAVIGWNDATIKDYHNLSWTAGDGFNAALYYRIYYLISAANEFIRQTTDAQLAARGISASADIKAFRAEARFLRALAYYHALDLYGGNVPFVTENDAVGAFFPTQTKGADLFTYIETELKAIDADLIAPRQEYGRADKAAAYTLLAKLYLNAKVYTGTAKYTDALTYCNKVIAAGYTLEAKYANLFLADNNVSKENIFSVQSDGTKTQTYGNMTFLVHAPVGGSMNPADFGIDGGWSGLRTTKGLVNLFADPSGKTDKRASFYTNGQNLDIADVSTFTDGYAVTKFKNVTSAGKVGSNLTFPDTDFPMFRLADVYLMYAEAVLNGGTGGDQATAISYVNLLRQRAYGSNSGNVTSINLDFILAERGRELFWEGHRRTDLIRFGKFTDASYLWPLKGGVAGGRGVAATLNIFPLPASDVTANPNLKQNAGY
jgi:starch-binding outer membrane protein, SusD/RagB family